MLSQIWTLTWQALVALSVLITVAGGVAFVVRWVKTHLSEPVIHVHYWWETVLDANHHSLAPAMTVGTTYPTKEQQEGRQLYRVRGLYRLAATVERDPRELPISWLMHPVYRLPRSHGVRILRFMMLNSSKTKPVKEDDLGKLVVEIQVDRHWVLHWRKGDLGERASGEQIDPGEAIAFMRVDEMPWLQRPWEKKPREWRPASLDVTLPHGLSPREKIRDDLTVIYTRSNPQPPKVFFKKTGQVRVRVKDWKPSKNRPWWSIPARIRRWLQESEPVPLWVPR